MTRALIFPGQGSQFLGMGHDLADSFAAAREVFDCVDEALGQNLFKLMTTGTENELNFTENTQPALMAVSMAVVNVLKEEAGLEVKDIASFVAGHSLGEYAALTAAGAFDLADAARLLRTRGQAMQKAVPVGVGSMAAILGLDMGAVELIAEDITRQVGGRLVCQAANDNAPGQVVISGHKQAVELAIEMACARGAKRAVVLPVSAAFHSTLMAPAAKVMEEALSNTKITVPVVPVVANVTAQATSDPEQIRAYLVAQVTGRVRWRESVLWMKDQGVTEAIELGAGKVLSGLVRRIDRHIEVSSVGTSAQIESLIEKLKG